MKVSIGFHNIMLLFVIPSSWFGCPVSLHSETYGYYGSTNRSDMCLNNYIMNHDMPWASRRKYSIFLARCISSMHRSNVRYYHVAGRLCLSLFVYAAKEKSRPEVDNILLSYPQTMRRTHRHLLQEIIKSSIAPNPKTTK